MKLHILLVDDEEAVEFIFLNKFKDWIRAEKVKLSFAIDGLQALEKLASDTDGEINLVLSDINMPKMDGFELLKNIKDKYPHIPAILISAYSMDDYKVKAKNLGAIDFYEKPVDFEKIKLDILNRFPVINY